MLEKKIAWKNIKQKHIFHRKELQIKLVNSTLFIHCVFIILRLIIFCISIKILLHANSLSSLINVIARYLNKYTSQTFYVFLQIICILCIVEPLNFL